MSIVFWSEMQKGIFSILKINVLEKSVSNLSGDTISVISELVSSTSSVTIICPPHLDNDLHLHFLVWL